MIQDVTFERTLYHGRPQRFEAGTGNIADAVGLWAAIDYLDRIGMPNVSRHEHALLIYVTEQLLRVPGLRIIGTAREKAGVISFTLEGFRTEEVGDYLNRNGRCSFWPSSCAANPSSLWSGEHRPRILGFVQYLRRCRPTP